MTTTIALGICTILLYIFDAKLNWSVVRNVFGLSFLIQLAYVIGSYLGGWPVLRPLSAVQIVLVVAMGTALGVWFARFWPLPEETGMERVIRTFLIGAPAIGIGIGLQLLLQGPQARQAIYLIFAISAWLGSGQVRADQSAESEQEEPREHS